MSAPIRPIEPRARGGVPRRTTLGVVALLLATGLGGAADALATMSGETTSARGTGTPLGFGVGLGPQMSPEPPSAAAAIAAYSGLSGAAGRHGATDERLDRIDACVMEEMATTSTPGASIAILVDGEIVHARGFGVKHEDMEAAVDAETVFRIGSTTKMMTAAAVLQQIEAGTLSIDTPITDVVPEWALGGVWDSPAETADDMTVWHTLTHTSGYPDRIIYDLTWEGATTPDGLDDWAGAQGDVMLHAPPGSFWNYTNGPFALAGLLVQRASGVPYHEYMVDSVWRPAGMDATFLVPEDVIAYGNFAYGHHYRGPLSADDPEIAAPDAYDNWVIAPAGYAFSTPSDLVRWTDLLMTGGGDVLDPTSVDAMQARQVDVGVVPQQGYGFGIFVEDIPALDGLRILSHGGNIPGFSSQLYWVPARRLAISILANTMTSLNGSAGCALINMLEVEPGEGPDHSTPPSEWDRYAGVYRGLDSLGNEFGAWIERAGPSGLRITFPEIVVPPGVAYTSALEQIALDTFSVDLDGDSEPENSITFVDTAGDSEPAAKPRWLRNRAFVMTYRDDQIPTPTPTAAITATATITATVTATPPVTATVTAMPSETPTPASTPTLLPTSLPSATPTTIGGTTPTPIPGYPEVVACPGLEARAPASAIDAALANPASVRGYGMRCYPSQPASPFNAWRRWLGLVDHGKAYSPRYNPIVIKCGCP